mmetsp:Transcript_46978/g.87841  ORF Transcript_46978/g.87841 Transcript_46978/m.87841 type:complete len:351 (+) Transcript_46978:115-1167(+)
MAMRVLLLTPERHKQGAWLLNLEAELLKSQPSLSVDIISIEQWGQQHFEMVATSSWQLAVNRVSDASEPAVAKLALVIMRQLELYGTPLVNPSSAYSLLMSKSGHHSVLRAAGVAHPESAFVNGLGLSTGADVLARLSKSFSEPVDCKLPLLYKPCAAAYAKGVVTMNNLEDLRSFAGQIEASASESVTTTRGPLGNDCTGFLQKYCPPDRGEYFRVFVLDGICQCAIKVVPRNETSMGYASVTSTCACSASKTVESPLRFLAYSPTEEEASEAVKILAKVARADCGSVEFLYHEGKRLYFDVNLLSHLPVRASDADGPHFPGFEDPAGLWSGRNFYSELAAFCLGRLRS